MTSMKKASKSLSIDEVKHIAKLAKLKLSDSQIAQFTPQLTSVLDYVSKIQSLDTKGVTETSQVTGLENVFREDKVDKNRMLTQKVALSNAPSTYKGYIKIKAIFDEE